MKCSICEKEIKDSNYTEDSAYWVIDRIYTTYDREIGVVGEKEIRRVMIICNQCYKNKIKPLIGGK